MTQQTIGQWLEELSSGNTSTDTDDTRLETLLHQVGFPKARCVCGICYLEGRGTLNAPPMPIQQIAKMLVDIARQRGWKL